MSEKTTKPTKPVDDVNDGSVVCPYCGHKIYNWADPHAVCPQCNKPLPDAIALLEQMILSHAN